VVAAADSDVCRSSRPLPQTLIMLPLGSALLFWHREGLGMTPSLAGNRSIQVQAEPAQSLRFVSVALLCQQPG
jgi:hypothetical protein